jgi:hypothetical protein
MLINNVGAASDAMPHVLFVLLLICCWRRLIRFCIDGAALIRDRGLPNALFWLLRSCFMFLLCFFRSRNWFNWTAIFLPNLPPSCFLIYCEINTLQSSTSDRLPRKFLTLTSQVSLVQNTLLVILINCCAVVIVYAATKAFNIAFSNSLAAEVKGQGCDVLAVSPAYVESQMSKVSSSLFVPTSNRFASGLIIIFGFCVVYLVMYLNPCYCLVSLDSLNKLGVCCLREVSPYWPHSL